MCQESELIIAGRVNRYIIERGPPASVVGLTRAYLALMFSAPPAPLDVLGGVEGAGRR